MYRFSSLYREENKNTDIIKKIKNEIKSTNTDNQITIHGYCRVSNPLQIKEGSGLESQEQAIKDFIHKHNIQGNLIIYKDSALSGNLYIDKRPQLELLINNLKPNDFVISRVDRLSRSSIDFNKLDCIFHDKNVQFMSYLPSDNISLNKHKTCEDILFQDISKYVAQKEREKIQLNTRNGMLSKKLHNKQYSGRIPYGYKIDNPQDRNLIINEEEQHIINLIIKLHDENNLKFPTIARYLTTNNYPKRIYPISDNSKYKNVKEWTISSVQNIYTKNKSTNEY
jgi:DNA invertase Pin-like site-specific DNA recombinase